MMATIQKKDTPETVDSTEKMEQALQDPSSSPSYVPKRRKWLHLTSTILFVVGSALYMVMAIDDYLWCKEFQTLPMEVRIADDDVTWTNYRKEELYNASLVEDNENERKLKEAKEVPTSSPTTTTTEETEVEKTKKPKQTQAPTTESTTESTTEETEAEKTKKPKQTQAPTTESTTESTTEAPPSTGPTPVQLYDDLWWNELPEDIQSAYELLGYDATIWDEGGISLTAELEWSELTVQQQNAARLIGYTEETWNAEQGVESSGGGDDDGDELPVQGEEQEVNDDDAVEFLLNVTESIATNSTPADGEDDDQTSTATTTTATATTSVTTEATTTGDDEAVVGPGYYEEYDWDELPPHVQQAWQVLGYTQSKSRRFLSFSGSHGIIVLMGYMVVPSSCTYWLMYTHASPLCKCEFEIPYPSFITHRHLHLFRSPLTTTIQALWDRGGKVETEDLEWRQLSSEQQQAATLLGYDEYSWDGTDPPDTQQTATDAASASTSTSSMEEDDYESVDDDYVFLVKSSNTWVSKYMIIYFCAALCFVIVGFLDLIREKKKFHVLMIIAGLTGLVSAMLVENYQYQSDIFNAISVHFFLLEALALFENHKRQAIPAEDDVPWLQTSMIVGDTCFAVGALLDAVVSLFLVLL